MSAALRSKVGCLAPGLDQLPDTFDSSVVENKNAQVLAKRLAKLFVNAAPTWVSALRERAATIAKEAAKANNKEAEKSAALAPAAAGAAAATEPAAHAAAASEEQQLAQLEAEGLCVGDIVMIGSSSKKYGGDEARVTKLMSKQIVVVMTSGNYAGEKGRRFRPSAVNLIKPSALRKAAASGRKAPDAAAAVAPAAAAAEAAAAAVAPEDEAAAAAVPEDEEESEAEDAGSKLAQLLMNTT